MKTLPLYLILLLALSSCTANKDPEENQQRKTPYVIMLSMDGFRWDYTSRTETPNFDFIAENGVKAEFLKPSFPTKTFPNHYSMATGLYPDNHGIVNNSFYAPDLDLWYSMSNRDAVENPDFYFGEPIWVSAEKQNIPTASFFWVGSETPIQGIQPRYWKKYEHNFPYEQRIDTVIHWLNLPHHKRPKLITFYFDQPDSDGHYYGPDAKEINSRVEKLDKLLGMLIGKLNELPVKDSVNLIVVSDHGMGATSPKRAVSLSSHIDIDWCEYIVGGNPVYNIKAKPEKYDQLYEALQSIDHIKVWKNSEVPGQYHYGSSSRTLDFTVVADSSYSILKTGGLKYAGGTHGYCNNNSDMYGIFYAFGPNFKTNYTMKGFENVNLYILISHILDIKPVDTDGKLENIEDMLINQSY